MSITTDLVVVDRNQLRTNCEARNGQFACLIIKDTGCGIPLEHQSRVFEPFFTTKDVGEGTGLGLATVYGIVKQHKGWIELSSQVGGGTTFRIYFPIAAETPVLPGAPDKSVPSAGGNETILVVEDEPALRSMVCQILELYGYNILSAENGPEAIEVWHAHVKEIDLLLTDMVMPKGMSGPQLAQKLLAERPDLPVIYTSGYSAEVAGPDLDLREGQNFLPKPYQPQKLAEIIRARLHP